jgi:thiol-disulfide isomerase/thioredoxin
MPRSRLAAPTVLFVSSFIAAAGSGCATSGAARPPAQGIGRPLPALVVSSLSDGARIDLASLRGKVVLLDIWASWCAPCRDEMPLLDEMAARLKSRGVEIVAVSIDTEKASAEAFLTSRTRWNLTLAHDPQGLVPELLQPGKMPTSYVIDATGVVRHINEGFDATDAEQIEARLLALADRR